MKKSTFKMNGWSGHQTSPIKQDSKKTFDTIQRMKSKAKKFVKNLKTKNIVKVGGKRLTGILGFMGGGSLSATAGNIREKSTGEQIKHLLKKHNLKGGK